MVDNGVLSALFRFSTCRIVFRTWKSPRWKNINLSKWRARYLLLLKIIYAITTAISSHCFHATFFVLQRRELATQLDLEGSFKKRQEVHIFGSLPATELFSLARIFVICRSPSFAVNIETTELAVFRGKLTDVNKWKLFLR